MEIKEGIDQKSNFTIKFSVKTKWTKSDFLAKRLVVDIEKRSLSPLTYFNFKKPKLPPLKLAFYYIENENKKTLDKLHNKTATITLKYTK